MADATPRRTYSQEEVTEILKRALRQQSLRNNQLSHDELLEMANEVGIDRDALDAATADLAQTRQAELVQHDEARELAEERTRRFSQFVWLLFLFLVIGVGLFLINRQTGGNWFIYPATVFSVLLAIKFRSIFFPHEGLERRRRHALREARKQERRAARDAWRNRMQASFVTPPVHGVNQAVNHGAKEFEAAVQAGVAALLNVAAKKIQAHADRAVEPDESRLRRGRSR